jgi:hypothetical protein
MGQFRSSTTRAQVLEGSTRVALLQARRGSSLGLSGSQRPCPELAGDCGSPTVAEAPTFVLPKLNSTADFPPGWQSTFDPEPACSFSLAAQYLQACLQEGPSPGCCSLLTSPHPFLICMCEPTFWKVRHGVLLGSPSGGHAEPVVQA